LDTLTEIVRNVVALVLVFTCLELFLPAGELSRFVRLAFGLILLALIIVPAAKALRSWDWQQPDWTASGEVSAAYDDNAAALQLILNEQAMDEYEAEAARQIAAIAALAEGVSESDAVVAADEGGAIERVEVSVTLEPGLEMATVEAEIRSLLSRFFNLAQENLYIEIREDG
jgi:stage III sporulation protein AF